jgi:hypothetical protein
MAVATSLGIGREAAAAASTVLARAAVVHRFDPLALIPSAAGPAVEAQALALVARDATETEWPDPKADGQVVTLWRLTPEARRRELRKLLEDGTLDRALEAPAAGADEPFARHLRDALRGQMNPTAVPPSEREAAAAAARFAADAMDASQAGNMTEAVRALRTSLAETAEADRARGGLLGRLVGRGAERAALEAFAATGAIVPADRLPAGASRAIGVAAYLVDGPSGAGKSALISDIVRRWRSYPMRVPTPSSWRHWPQVADFAITHVESFAGQATSVARRLMDRILGRTGQGSIVVLDLGRLAFAIGGEIEWTAELTRQIGLGTPALVRASSALRKEVRAKRMLLDPTGKGVTARVAACADLKQGLAALLEAERAAGPPLVVVLDDFEEAVARSFPGADSGIAEALFGRVLLWADSLASLARPSGAPVFGTVRVIAAGSEPPPLEATALARWFEARLALRPRAAAVSERGTIAASPTPGAVRALERYRRAGPLRMHSDAVASLRGEHREAAMLSRLEFARQEGRPLSDAGETADLLAPDLTPESRGQVTAAEIGTSPDQLFAFLRDRTISAKIAYAFTFGDFAAAAALGWRRIGTVSDLPDLSEPWRLPGDPVAHWVWQTALAALALADASAVRPRLEDFLGKLARRLDPDRAGADAAALVLAAAATVALDGRIAPGLAAVTRPLAEKAATLPRVRSVADLRLLALHPVWRGSRALPSLEVEIPYRVLRLFSASLLEEPPPELELVGLERLRAFVADARIEAPSAWDIDTFTCTGGKIVGLFLAPGEGQRMRLADILVGLSPELHDIVVVALTEADRTTSAAIDRAIGAVRAAAPFWPRDVVPETSPPRDRDRRAGMIARAVIHADRCGLLCGLLESAAEQVGSDRLSGVTRLVQRYEALRRRAFAAAQPGGP